MREQRAWMPVEPDYYGAERVHPALKQFASNFYLPDFRKREIEQKVREVTLVARTELRHLGNFIWEWFCLSFQI
jgi:hypothetical protein